MVEVRVFWYLLAHSRLLFCSWLHRILLFWSDEWWVYCHLEIPSDLFLGHSILYCGGYGKNILCRKVHSNIHIYFGRVLYYGTIVMNREIVLILYSLGVFPFTFTFLFEWSQCWHCLCTLVLLRKTDTQTIEGRCEYNVPKDIRSSVEVQ